LSLPRQKVCHSMCGPGQVSDIILGSTSHLGWT